MMMLLVISLLVSSSLSLISNQIPYQPSSECGDHDVYSSVSLSCRQCGPGTRVTNSSGGECECEQGWILTRSGGAVECGQCPPGHEATSDGRQCIRCQSGGCGACPAGQVSVRCWQQWSYQDFRLATQQIVQIVTAAYLACGASVALGWLSWFKFCHPILRSLVATSHKNFYCFSNCLRIDECGEYSVSENV